MELNLVHLWRSMGLPSKSVALTLAVMAVLSLGVLIERLVYLSRVKRESRTFAQRALEIMRRGELVELSHLAVKHAKSPLAKLVHAGSFKYLEIADEDRDSALSPLEGAKREMTRKAEVVSAELRRGLSVLASIGSLAPFVGLLGTVLGILGAFAKIGATGSGGLGSVSAGIAEALYETAFGLFVAIPSVGVFNYLNGRIEAMERDLTNATGEFLDDVERRSPMTNRDSGEALVAAE